VASSKKKLGRGRVLQREMGTRRRVECKRRQFQQFECGCERRI